jgi:3'-5' exoribonuclease
MPSSSDETVRKIFTKDLREKERVHTVFRVFKKSRVTARSGKSFLALSLGDRTGEIDGRVFDNVESAEAAFQADDYLLVRGEVIRFQGRLQLKVDTLERLDPGPIDAKEFEPPPERAQAAGAPAEGAAGHRTLALKIGHPGLKGLVMSLYDDPETSALDRGEPGAHHARVAEVVLDLVGHYPKADRDLALAAALIHDLGRVLERREARPPVPGAVLAAQKIKEKVAQGQHLSIALERQLTHVISSAPGGGALTAPASLEAHLVASACALELGARELTRGGKRGDKDRPKDKERPKKDRPEEKLQFRPLSDLVSEPPPPAEGNA